MNILSTKALLGTAVSFALLSTANVASAADLDNLSDDDLLARIERLEKIIGPSDKGNAVRNGNNAIRLTLSGQINRLAIASSDGVNRRIGNADNTTSSTRFRLVGSAKLSDDWKAGTIIEIESQGEASAAFSQISGNPNGDILFGEARRAAFWVDHKRLGRLTVGQFQTASDFSFHNDLSGTFVAGYSETHLIGGDLAFRSAGGISSIRIDEVTAAGFDGGGRDDVIRYDTASFKGFKLSASYTNDEEYAVNLAYKSKDLAGFAVDSDIAWTDFGTDATDDSVLSGSISVVHKSTGLNLTYSGAFRNENGAGAINGRETAHYGKLGWQKKLSSLGRSNFVFEAGTFSNLIGGETAGISEDFEGGGAAITVAGESVRGRVLGASFVQNIDKFGMEAFVAFRNYSVSGLSSGVALNDINYITSGARVKF